MNARRKDIFRALKRELTTHVSGTIIAEVYVNTVTGFANSLI